MLGRFLRAVRDRKVQRVVKIDTGLPTSIGFSARTQNAPTLGGVLLVGNVELRGDAAFWLGVLDAETRRDLSRLVQVHRATLREGRLELHDVTPPTVRCAEAIVERMRDAFATTDDGVLFAACKHGSLRERLMAVMLVRKQRPDDARTTALLAELNASTEPDVQMLADIASARWSRIRGHADNTRFDDLLLAEAVATLRALYPHIDAGTGDARAQLRAICAVLV